MNFEQKINLKFDEFWEEKKIKFEEVWEKKNKFKIWRILRKKLI